MKKLLLSLILFVSACAHPTTRAPSLNHYDLDEIRQKHVKASVRHDYKRDKRIYGLFYNLQKTTGQELCDKKLKPDTGIHYAKINKYKGSFFGLIPNQTLKDQTEDLKLAYNQPEETVFVRFVIPNSSADKAGIKENDKIISIFGVSTPTGDDALEDTLELIEKHSKDGLNVDIEVERNNKNINLSFAPDMVCPYPLSIDTDMRQVNAYATGDEVFVTPEIIDYLNDNDLAAVMAHELAHNTMGHINAKMTNIMIGTFAGAAADVWLGTDYAATTAGATFGNIVFSKEFETEADYVMTYYMARAGYDYHKAKDLEKSLAARNYRNLYEDNETHPRPQYRYALIKETAIEIDTKKAFGEPIMPDFSESNSWLKQQRD